MVSLEENCNEISSKLSKGKKSIWEKIIAFTNKRVFIQAYNEEPFTSLFQWEGHNVSIEYKSDTLYFIQQKENDTLNDILKISLININNFEINSIKHLMYELKLTCDEIKYKITIV